MSRSITRKAGIIGGLAAAGALTLSAPAYASGGPSQSGQVSGSVQVGETLTIQLVNTSFTVANALPGVTDNGVPPIGVKILTNDSAGYTLTTYLNDVSQAPFPSCGTNAFVNGSKTVGIPDNAWSDTSTGGPGAAGTPQTYPEQGSLSNGNGGCSTPGPLPITVGGSNTVSAASGDSFSEQLAVVVPGNEPSDTYTGTLTFAAIGS